MWPSTRLPMYEKVAKDDASEASTLMAQSSERLLPPLEDSFDPKFLHTRAFKYWLLVTSAAMAALLVIDISLRGQAISRQIRYIETPIPEFPIVFETFKSESPWLQPPSPESNLRWMEEIGPGDGKIAMHEPRHYNLKPGLPGVGGENFGISMFHSLHCLILIRQAWWEARSGGENITYYRANLDRGPLEFGEVHVTHCLNYVRQSIKCAGDMTVEWAREEGSRHLNAMDGEVHQCRNFDSMRVYMDANLPFPTPEGDSIME